MNQEVLSRLDALAAKLGVAANHLWGVLVRQAYVDALGSLLFALIAAALTYGFYRVVLYGRAEKWYDGYDTELAVVGTGVVGVGLVVCVVIALVQLVAGIQNVANPEYFALRHVLGALK